MSRSVVIGEPFFGRRKISLTILLCFRIEGTLSVFILVVFGEDAEKTRLMRTFP